MKTFTHPNWTIINLTPTWYDPIEWDTYTITSEVIKQLWFIEDKQEETKPHLYWQWLVDKLQDPERAKQFFLNLSRLKEKINNINDDLWPTAVEWLAQHKQEDWIDKAFREYELLNWYKLDRSYHKEFKQAILKHLPK